MLHAAAACCLAMTELCSFSSAQSVGLPAPRLLTTMPMGGAAGSEFEVTVDGDYLDDVTALTFSEPRLSARPVLNAKGNPAPNKFVVTIDAECPVGVYDARVMTRLGLSSSRAFSVGTLPEVVRQSPNTAAAAAMELNVNSVCNATVTERSVDHYAFEARRGQRLLVDCAAKGIDSKLIPVVIVADASGNDLLVERRGDALEFVAPDDGRYLIKIHELTFRGGPSYFYRLVLRELTADEPIVRHPATRTVNSFSWPPQGLAAVAPTKEQEPNDNTTQAQQITLPCDIAGAFAPAADLFEFTATKGEQWWVEVASERFGLPTDPAIIVQHVSDDGGEEKLTDVAELSDLPSPVKVSSNGYSYDGPPYNVGSSDILGKLTIPRDGRYRLKLIDLFGGTRNEPQNVYRLVIRKAQPDFALAAWALHMGLRNGDRTALSKPIALRAGATMAIEIVAVRRDGFDGEIDLAMEGLPKGVRATGLKIPAGKSRGIMLVSADASAADAFASATFVGRANIAGTEVTRPCHLASVTWPVSDARSEIPSPRLLADVLVSVTSSEPAPLTISPGKPEPIVAAPNAKVTIPLALARRAEFNGGKMSVQFFGTGFETAPSATLPLTTDDAEVELDLKALKIPPGEHVLALYGGAVTNYRSALDKAAQPKGIVDIVVSEPIVVRVQSTEAQ
jgi:hypothetical protein